jgi:hypothetical protein
LGRKERTSGHAFSFTLDNSFELEQTFMIADHQRKRPLRGKLTTSCLVVVALTVAVARQGHRFNLLRHLKRVCIAPRRLRAGSHESRHFFAASLLFALTELAFGGQSAHYPDSDIYDPGKCGEKSYRVEKIAEIRQAYERIYAPVERVPPSGQYARLPLFAPEPYSRHSARAFLTRWGAARSVSITVAPAMPSRNRRRERIKGGTVFSVCDNNKPTPRPRRRIPPEEQLRP